MMVNNAQQITVYFRKTLTRSGLSPPSTHLHFCRKRIVGIVGYQLIFRVMISVPSKARVLLIERETKTGKNVGLIGNFKNTTR